MNGGGGPGSIFGCSCSCNKGAFSLVSGCTVSDGDENPKLSAILRESVGETKSCDNRSKYLTSLVKKENTEADGRENETLVQRALTRRGRRLRI